MVSSVYLWNQYWNGLSPLRLWFQLTAKLSVLHAARVTLLALTAGRAEAPAAGWDLGREMMSPQVCEIPVEVLLGFCECASDPVHLVWDRYNRCICAIKKYSENCEIFLQCKTAVFHVNILGSVIYCCDRSWIFCTGPPEARYRRRSVCVTSDSANRVSLGAGLSVWQVECVESLMQKRHASSLILFVHPSVNSR